MTEIRFIIALIITAILLIISSNYSINLEWDKFSGRYCIFWQKIKDDWTPDKGRRRELNLHYIILPKFLNIFHNES